MEKIVCNLIPKNRTGEEKKEKKSPLFSSLCFIIMTIENCFTSTSLCALLSLPKLHVLMLAYNTIYAVHTKGASSQLSLLSSVLEHFLARGE